MIRAGEFVLVYLRDPREKYWGRVEQLDQTGVAVRGMELSMVEEWARELARDQVATMGPSSVFFPLWRVEKVYLDEDVGAMSGVRSTFLKIVGRDVEEYIRPAPRGDGHGSLQ